MSESGFSGYSVTPQPIHLETETDGPGEAQIILVPGPDSGINRVGMIVENVNGDGDVNIQDLVLVDSNFGQRAPMTGDVNGDGVVNIADSVSGTMSNAAAAPAAGLEGER